MKAVFFGLLAVMLTVAGCSTPTSIGRSEIVDRSYSRFNSVGGAKMQWGLKVAEHNGKVMLCGAITANGSLPFLDQHLEYWRDKTIVSVGGEKVAQGVPYAPLYEGEATVMGKTAKCGVVDKPWKPSYASAKVSIRILSGYVGS